MHAPSLPRLLRLVLIVSIASVAALLQASCARSVTDSTESAPLFGSDAGAASSGGLCVSTECPPPWATCPGGGLCTTDTSRDVRNCGACNNVCPRPSWELHASALCAGGKCVLACDELYADCNHSDADGCETSTADDPKNCGFCGNACKEGELCWRGACGCPNGFTQCGNQCKKLDSDNDNCGACGKACRAPSSPDDPAWTCGPAVTPPNTKWMCASSACSLQCAPGFGDCNNAFCADGCEIDLKSDPLNCGACGRKCEGAQECVAGACICPAGTWRCGDECVDIQTDPTNCGECGNRCPGPAATRPGRPGGGSPACVGGKCTYECFPGFADCDDFIGNGCEVNLASDPYHCGSCDTKCKVTAGQPCVLGQCLTRECDAGVVF